jgi:hypothetical protein
MYERNADASGDMVKGLGFYVFGVGLCEISPTAGVVSRGVTRSSDGTTCCRQHSGISRRIRSSTRAAFARKSDVGSTM